jgi:multidrug efflux system membrane fusion protein
MRRFLGWTVVLLVLAGAGGWWARREGHLPPMPWLDRLLAGTIAAPAPARPPNPPPIVGVAIATRSDLPVFLDAIGTVQAYQTVTVRSRVEGQLLAYEAREGQEVAAGDVIARIDPRIYKAQLDQALAQAAQDRAQLDNARRDAERFRSLAGQNFISRQQLDTAVAQVAQLEATQLANAASVEIARVNLSHTTVTAPIAGRLGLRQLDAGNMVRAGDAQGLVTITQLRPIALSFTLPQQALPAVNARLAGGEALAVEATVPGVGEPERGTVELVDNQIDATTGTIRLKAVFPNPTLALWPGGFVNVRLRLDTIRDAVLVPGTAIQFGPDGVFAYVVGQDLRAQPRPLRIGRTDGERTVVLSGIEPGERVVVTGQDRLRAGARVTIAGQEGAGPRGAPPPRRPPGTGS